MIAFDSHLPFNSIVFIYIYIYIYIYISYICTYKACASMQKCRVRITGIKYSKRKEGKRERERKKKERESVVYMLII